MSKKEYTKLPPSSAGASRLRVLGWYTDHYEPHAYTLKNDIVNLFNEIAEHENISDIVIKSGEPVSLKTRDKGLRAISHRVLNHTEIEQFAIAITDNKGVASILLEGKPLSGLVAFEIVGTRDISTGLGGKKRRYRYEATPCAGVYGNFGISIILRPLPDDPPLYSDIGLEMEFVNNCIVNDGIVIIAGSTGSGKTTTMSAVIRYILENDTLIKGIIITHEDPIEISFENIKSEHSIVIQSAIGRGQHINSFADANRSAMRRSPNLALLGELRDGDTIEASVELSLTGHPVFATTHANDVKSIMPRLVSRFEKELQSQKAYDLVTTIRYLIAQKLVWRTDGKMMAVRETLKFTPALRDILLPIAQETEKLYYVIGEIMEQGLFGAVSYKSQADKLMADGIIDEDSYNRLVDTKGTMISEKDEKAFMQAIQNYKET